MITNVTRLAYKVGERVYHFFCDNDSPLGECHDALSKFKTHVVEIIKMQEEASKSKEEKKENE